MASLKTCGFVALDGMDTLQAARMIEMFEGKVLGIKLTDLLDQDACEMLTRINMAGLVAWADAKFHDIPTTVANRVCRLASYGASIITVHASGGPRMIEAAVKAYHTFWPNGMGIVAVTVLTSLDEADCHFVYGGDPLGTSYNLGQSADIGGAFGLVCSPQEVGMLKKALPRLKRFTPGIRSLGADAHDQSRVDTPANALENGADYLVIGREITQASDPLEAIRRIDESIAHLP